MTKPYDDLSTKHITLTVKCVDDRWEFFYGGLVPVKQGTIAELKVPFNAITDERFKDRVTSEVSVKILDQNMPLIVALSDRSQNGAKIGSWPKHLPRQLPPGTTRFEEVLLGPARHNKESSQMTLSLEDGSGLWLRVKGLEKCELRTGTILIKKHDEQDQHIPAVSLNHAFTLLSERYETHRISHTGNVYERFFYQEPNGNWYPLKDLREGVLADIEREFLFKSWAEIERQLGWRPMPASSRESNR